MKKIVIQKNQLKRMQNVLNQDKRNQNKETEQALRCELAGIINKYAKLQPRGLMLDIIENSNGVKISLVASCSTLKAVK